MSERRVRLLYTTTCRSCADAVPAGTAMWWDDDRRQATCGTCVAEREVRSEALVTTPGGVVVDERTHRRHQIIRARQPRPAARRTGGFGPRRTTASA